MGALIQRATELQQENSDSLDHGLSIDEIERIAGELGLDPEHLRTAAQEIENRLEDNAGTTFWGAPFQIDLKRVLDGALTEDQWEEIVMALRRASGNSGNTSEIGKTKEWSHSLDEGIMQTRVSLSPRNGQTTVEIQKQYRHGAYFAYFLALFFGGFLTGIALDGAAFSEPVMFTLFGSGCASSLLAMRYGISSWSKRQKEKASRMMRNVIEVFSKSEVQEDVREELTHTLSKVAEDPQIDLPDLTEESTTTTAIPRKERI